MNKAQMLRLLQEYPLDNDEFEWKWFGTLKFPNSPTLRNAGKILLQWRNELEQYEGTDSLNLIWIMECSRIGICFHVVAGGHRIKDKKRWMSRWQELGGVGALHRYCGDECIFKYFATHFIHFGASEQDANRYIFVQHNYVYRQFTTPKSNKPRRVDMSRQLGATLLALRNERLIKAFLAGKNSVSDELVFPAPNGGVLDPDHLYDRYFLPVVEKAGLRRIRFHDLRHTFGHLLIQAGAPLPYVRDQMGHSSIQVTADIYGHLLPGANVACIDKLDAPITPQLSATQTQPAEGDTPVEEQQLFENAGAGGGIEPTAHVDSA